jgi:LysM repeat protein
VKPVSATESRPAVATVEYVVKSGDTLEKIARRELGNRDQIGKILALNKGVNPSKLKVGQKILLPAVARESRTVAEAPKPKAKEKEKEKAATPSTPPSSRRQFEPVSAKSGRTN